MKWHYKKVPKYVVYQKYNKGIKNSIHLRGLTESILSSVNKALFRKLIRNFQLQNFIPCLFSKFHPMIFKSVPINFKYLPINFKHVPISYQFNHSVKTV